jgi:hypothetical protein
MEEKQQTLLTPLFDEREEKLIKNCVTYAENNPAGLPGHNLMLIIAKQDAIIKQLVDSYNELYERHKNNFDMLIKHIGESKR